MPKEKVTPEIKRHFDAVADLRCCVSESPFTVLHHARGGSMLELPKEFHPGKGQRPSHWFVLPLSAPFHNGAYGIHGGTGVFDSVEDWEEELGTQLYFLRWVSNQLGYNVFEKAGVDQEWLDQKWIMG